MRTRMDEMTQIQFANRENTSHFQKASASSHPSVSSSVIKILNSIIGLECNTRIILRPDLFEFFFNCGRHF
jgi:hypothetical protein